VAARDGAGVAAATPPYWLPLKERALDLARFGNVLASRQDEVFVAGLAVLFLTVAILGAVRRSRPAWRVIALAGATLLAYLCAPFDIGYMGYIGLRALPFLVLTAIASPSLASGRLTSALCVAAVLLQISYSAVLVRAAQAFTVEAQARELMQVLGAAQTGKRLFALIPDQESRVMQFRPYLHFGSYYQVLRGGRSQYNFAETPWTPVRFRGATNHAPLPRSWELHPERIVPSVDAADDDYLLLRSPNRDPGPAFRLLATAGRWALYGAAR
jgi:hypothetical protein